MAAAVIPLPGGTGMMEIGFILAFSTADMLGNNVVWGLLVWRIISYYLLILHGFTQTMIDGAVKHRQEKKKLQNT